MPAYSLIVVDAITPDGRVSGTWGQDCCRGLRVGFDRCRGTSAVNGGQCWALVAQFGGPCALLDGARVDGVVPEYIAGAPEGTVLPLHQRAYDAGQAAFARGATRVPALDAAVRPLVADCGQLQQRLGVTGAARARACATMLGWWTAGWDAANLAAPVPAH